MSQLYPAFLKLDGLPVVVVGGGPVAASKLDGLIAAGARVTVVAPDVVAEIRNRAAVRVIDQAFRPAHLAGARWVVLCDTNGGTLPGDVGRIVAEVIASGIPGDCLGIHCHDDTGNAVACTLAAVEAGVRQVQGTLNGLGERCGNASLTSLIPTLMLKEPFRSTVAVSGSS